MLSSAFLYPTAADRERFLQDLLREKQLINYELSLKHKKGRLVDVLENVFLDVMEDGTATIQGTLIDIAAIKQAEMEQTSLTASYRSLVEHMRDGVMVVRDGRIHYANPAAQRLMGQPLIGMDLSGSFAEADARNASVSPNKK